MGRLLNVTGIVTFIREVLKDDELKAQLEKLKDQLPQLSRKMQSMMAEIRPAISTLMSGMMDFMAGKVMPVMMPVMMPMMSEMMPVMMKEKMPQIMESDGTVREFISGMMMEIMPHCVQTLSPMMESKDQNIFLAHLTDSIARAEGLESPEEEQKA
jgi:hypothetical protein